MPDLATDRAPERDWFLALLVDHVNKHGGSIPLTVTIGGSVVSGTLIGVGEYYKHTAEDLSEVFPSRAESITAALQDAGKQSVDSVRKHKNQVRAAETKLETPHFLHLRDVRYVSAGSRTQASLWRAHP